MKEYFCYIICRSSLSKEERKVFSFSDYCWLAGLDPEVEKKKAKKQLVLVLFLAVLVFIAMN